PSVPELNSTSLTINIKQWYQWNLESISDKHIHNRNNHLYIYSGSRAVWRKCNDGYCDHNADHSNLHSNRSSVPELNSTSLTINIKQWYQWNMESITD